MNPPPPPAPAPANDLLEIVRHRFGNRILSLNPSATPPTIEVRRDGALDLLRFLRDDPAASFDCLIDLCGVDSLNRDTPGRFAIVYHLFSFVRRGRVRVRTYAPETDPEVDSAAGLWAAADWAEREAFDMYGIRFKGHPDLRRILLPDAYEGYPLRKDYPLEGRGERDRFPKYVP
jgi:NADH-quinone oxidoreductase subunit C